MYLHSHLDILVSKSTTKCPAESILCLSKKHKTQPRPTRTPLGNGISGNQSNIGIIPGHQIVKKADWKDKWKADWLEQMMAAQKARLMAVNLAVQSVPYLAAHWGHLTGNPMVDQKESLSAESKVSLKAVRLVVH